MIQIIALMLTLPVFAGVKERLDALPDMRQAAIECGINEPNLKILEHNIIHDADTSKIDCMESKTAIVLEKSAKSLARMDAIKKCKSDMKNINVDAMSDSDKNKIMKCFVLSRG